MPMNRLRRSQGRMRERADWRNIIGEFEEEGVPGVPEIIGLGGELLAPAAIILDLGFKA